MKNIESIVPILDDAVSIKILGLWGSVQDIETISKYLRITMKDVSVRIEIMQKLNLIKQDGSISDPAKALLLSHATKGLKK